MIQVRRNEKIAIVNGEAVRVSKAEHALLKAIGMAGSRLITMEELIDVATEHPVKVPADVAAMRCRVCKLRRKLGTDFVQVRRRQGYVVTEEIEFI
jgi:DNA-binding response OmpR family regulator